MGGGGYGPGPGLLWGLEEVVDYEESKKEEQQKKRRRKIERYGEIEKKTGVPKRSMNEKQILLHQ